MRSALRDETVALNAVQLGMVLLTLLGITGRKKESGVCLTSEKTRQSLLFQCRSCYQKEGHCFVPFREMLQWAFAHAPQSHEWFGWKVVFQGIFFSTSDRPAIGKGTRARKLFSDVLP